MTNYTKITNFAAKDNLTPGDANKKVKGTEIDAEFNAIASASATKADLASPALTGTPTAPTAAAGTDTTQLATTAFVDDALTSGNTDVTVNDLTVNGDISYSGQTALGTVIAWGRMNGTDGSLVGGEGWTGSWVTTGTYTITLDTAYADANYAVVASSETNVGVEVDSFTTDTFQFRVRGANEVLQNSTVRFIVVG